MDNDFKKKYDEQTYLNKKRSAYLPRITMVDMDNLAAKEVQVEQLKMLHHLDAAVMALTRTLDEGISATPYDYVGWMDALVRTVSYVQDSIDRLRFEHREHTKALSRIADALERIAPSESRNNTGAEHVN